jgi:hypothetical protein
VRSVVGLASRLELIVWVNARSAELLTSDAQVRLRVLPEAESGVASVQAVLEKIVGARVAEFYSHRMPRCV